MRIPGDLPRQPLFPSGGFNLRRPRRSRVLLSLVLIVIVLLFVSARSVAAFYIDVLWHQSLERTDVFWGILLSRLGLASAFTLVFALVLALNMWVADRLRPETIPLTAREQALAGYRSLSAGRRMLFRIVVAPCWDFSSDLPRRHSGKTGCSSGIQRHSALPTLCSTKTRVSISCVCRSFSSLSIGRLPRWS